MFCFLFVVGTSVALTKSLLLHAVYIQLGRTTLSFELRARCCYIRRSVSTKFWSTVLKQSFNVQKPCCWPPFLGVLNRILCSWKTTTQHFVTFFKKTLFPYWYSLRHIYNVKYLFKSKRNVKTFAFSADQIRGTFFANEICYIYTNNNLDTITVCHYHLKAASVCAWFKSIYQIKLNQQLREQNIRLSPCKGNGLLITYIKLKQKK